MEKNTTLYWRYNQSCFCLGILENVQDGFLFMNKLLLSLNKVNTFLFVCLFKDIGNMLDFIFKKFRWIFLD